MRPPRYRRATLGLFACRTCGYMDRKSGRCRRYRVAVKPPMTCDTWRPLVWKEL